MNKTHNKSIWRCVDWGTDKAEERFKKVRIESTLIF